MQGSPLVHVTQKALQDDSFWILVNEKWVILCSVFPSPSIPQHQVCEQWQRSEASPASIFLYLGMENPGTAAGRERERDGQEVLIARTELGNSEINSIFSSGCITNCWAREENRCGLVGSRINSLEIKSQMASWKLPTLGRSKRALTEEGITLCPSKRNGNLTVCLSLLHTQERKKSSSTAFFEIPHDIKVIPTIRRVLSFLHFWNLESCVRFKPYKAVAPLDYPSECVVSCLCDCIHWGCRSDLSWQATHVSNCRHVFLLKLLFAWCLPGDAKSKSAQKQY